MELVKKSLNNSIAISYIENSLRNGKTLSKTIPENIDFKSGYTYAFLPKNIDLSEIYKHNFQSSILPAPSQSKWIKRKSDTIIPIPSTIDYLVKDINVFLKKNKNILIGLFEDRLANSKDFFLQNIKSKYVFYKTEVYYVLTSSDNNELIKEAIEDSESIPIFNGVISSLSSNSIQGLIQSKRINSKILAEIVTTIKRVIVGAFDGEGYIVWERKS